MSPRDIDLVPEQALAWFREGQGAALATVVETWGSAPRPPGSQMAISGHGAMTGSLAGGCIEAAVVAEALLAIADGQSRLLTYGVSDDNAFAARLACGGTIRVLVEPVGAALPADLLARLTEARQNRQPLAYRVNLTDWTRRLDPPSPALADRFRADLSGQEGDAFIAIHNPPLRLVIVGAVHIAQHLAPMARACGHDILIIDPRAAFATPERFPDQRISHDWPGAALAAFGLDSRTALVTLTHEAQIDDEALVAALASQAFYIGCLGSTRTHAARLARLAGAGLSSQALARLHAPVGLAIGARTPAEIALSILAELTRTLRQGA